MYLAIRDLNAISSYPISELCEIIGIQRSSYYKWLTRKESDNEKFNKELLPMIKDAYEEKNGILGYRQMTIKLNREHNLNVNHKRIYRLMHILNLKSVCRRKRKNYIKSTPEITAENILNREFESNAFGTKWLTDVTEMKYSLKARLILVQSLIWQIKVSFLLWLDIPTTMNWFLELLIWHVRHIRMLGQSFIVIVVSNIRARYSRRNWMMQE